MTTKVASKTVATNARQASPPAPARHYPIRYSVRDYTFPTADTIAAVRFDDKYIHIELSDERVLSIPLRWIPPLRDASPHEREKYHISPERDAIIWDPEESEVNEILRLTDYLRVRQAK